MIKKLKLHQGFTLIEILVVLVIVGVLAAIIIPSVMGFIGSGVEETARTDLRSVQIEVMSKYISEEEWGAEPDYWETIESNNNYLDADADFGDEDWWAGIQFENRSGETKWLYVNNQGITDDDLSQD